MPGVCIRRGKREQGHRESVGKEAEAVVTYLPARDGEARPAEARTRAGGDPPSPASTLMLDFGPPEPGGPSCCISLLV